MPVRLRKRRLPSGKVSLRLDIYTHGVRRFESLGMYLNGSRDENKKILHLAELIRAKRELEFQSDLFGFTAMYSRKSSFIEYFRKVVDRKEHEATKKGYLDAIAHLVGFRGERILFGELSKEFFEGFKLYLLKKVSANTAQKYLARIKHGLNEAVRENILPTNPASQVHIRKVEKLPVFLTLDEIKKLWATECGNDNVKSAFLFCCFCGLRYSDVRALTWDRIRDGYIEFTQQKTGSAERLPLSSQAIKILEVQGMIGKSEKILNDLSDNVVFRLPRRSTVDKVLRRWAKRAGIAKVVSFHKSRHSFATLSLTSGIDIYTVSKLLGHKNLGTTQIYARVVDEKKKQAVGMLPVISE